MIRRTLKADLLLLFTALVWGAAFVAQRVGMDHVGPFTFNGVRFALGALALIPLARYRHSGWLAANPQHLNVTWRQYVPSCLLAGLFLFTGASLQQVGLQYTTAGKAGFITGLYVVLVPLVGRLFGQKTDILTWLGAILAAAGLYFLSVTEQFTIASGDLLELIGAVFWAGHVLLVGRYATRLEPVTFSIGQFAVCSLLSLSTAGFRETITNTGLLGAAIPIAYGGLISVGIGYTLQVVAQKDAPPAHAAILLSLESVFAALMGWLLLNELMGGRALFGCVLMLAGMLLAQFGPSPDEKPPLIGTTGN